VPYVGAIDQGTSSTRFIIFDDSTRIVAESQVEHAQICPQPGWVEHDPVEIWRNTQTVVAGALRAAGLAPGDLAAIGITNQRETTLVWDRRTGRPLCNAIVWQDTRVAGYLPAYTAHPGVEFFRSRTGLPLSSYFSSLKLRWILGHVRGALELAERGDALGGTMDTFLVWQLTGGPRGGLHVTDVTNASRTQLMNIDALDWDPALLAAFGIPGSMLPPIRSSSERLGVVRAEPVEGVSIAALLGDQQAALVGQACFRAGEAKNTYGTGCFLLLNTGAAAVRSAHGVVTTVAYQMGGDAPCYILLLRPGLLGALRAALERRRARHDRRPDPVRDPGAHRAGRPRGHGVPDMGSARGHGKRLARAPRDTAG
jgi:glycerol kinase